MSAIRGLLDSNEKVSKLLTDGYFLSSIIVMTDSFSTPPKQVMVNLYNKSKNELASFSFNGNDLEFSGLSPPMKESEIPPLNIDKACAKPEDILSKCKTKVQAENIARVMLVLRTSTNSKSEAGPSWHVNIFLKNLKALSIIFDAENGEEIASTQMKMFK
ncbi:MAG: hypothetical protein V1836_01275 [Candidatus Aenigmatarchaeota archaeon]